MAQPSSISSSSTDNRAPLINPNPRLQSYYASLESRIGYRLLLGDTRHFGYWENDTWWPFPLTHGLRNMEDKLAGVLDLPRGAHVLDAGCGVGHVAIRMAATHGLRVKCIEVVPHHVDKARRNVAAAGLLDGAVTVEHMDYHHIQGVDVGSLDGIYTMETFVHATEPEAVLAGFRRLLKPGGHLAMFEYDHDFLESSPGDLANSMRKINDYAAMPTNALSNPGVFKKMLENAGFEDVVVRDLSDKIQPMTRLFFLLAIVPYLIVRLFGLERYFINTVAGVETYRGRAHWRYVAISAVNPGGHLEVTKVR